MTNIIVSVRDAVGTGGGSVALNTCKEFSKKGNNVIIVSDYPVFVDGCQNIYMPYGEKLNEWKPNLKVFRILRHFLQIFMFSIFGFYKIKLYENKGYISIDHNVESFGADIIVMHNIFIYQYLADKRRFLDKIKQFCNPVFLFRIIREWSAVNFGKSHFLVSVSDTALCEIDCINKKNKKSVVIENGVNLEKFKIISENEAKDIKTKLGCDNKFVVLFVGHEFVRKRLDLALKTISNLDEKFVLWVVGGRSGNNRSFEELTIKLGLSHRVFFLGSLEDPETIMSAADAFILLSDYETWGMVAIEALASGTPCIMTNVGCAQSVIKNGSNGYIVKNVEEATKALIEIDSNINNVDYSILSRKSVEKYSWENVAEKYLEIILECEKK